MPPKSKASTAVWPRRTLRATAKKSTPLPSNSTVAEISPVTTPSFAATPESTASLTSPEIQTTSHTYARTASKSTAKSSGEDSTSAPPRTAVESSAGDVTEAAAMAIVTPETFSGEITETSPHIGEQTKHKIGQDEALTGKASPPSEAMANQAARSENVDGSGRETAIEADQTTSKKKATRTVVKKTVRVVKKIVKRKVPKRLLKVQTVPSNEETQQKPGTVSAVGNPNCTVLGAMEVENPKSAEVVMPEVENYDPQPNPPVTLEVENPSDHVPTEAENCKANPCFSASIKIENAYSYVNVTNEIENPEVSETGNDAITVSMENGDESEKTVSVTGNQLEDQNVGLTIGEGDEKENTVSVTETQLENQKVGSIREGDESDKTVPVTVTPQEDQNVGSVRDGDESRKTVSVNETQLEDHNVGSIRERDGSEKIVSVNENQLEDHKECETENLGSGAGEGEKEEMESCEMGVLKGGVGMGDGLVLSGVMEAMERRRRRRTEIFIGGLDKDVKEEDIRKVFEEFGEIVEISLVMNGKEKNKGFAFVRFASADDAKKVLAKNSKVEICGKQCGMSLVKGNDTIFLGNIEKKWSSEDVLKLLQGIGIEKIDKVTVMADPSNIECNRGFAFLELESTKDAQYAYKKLQKKDVFGKNLKIKVAWAEPLNEPDEEEMLKVKSVYAEYIPLSWDEGKVRDFFQKFGEIENVALARNLRSSRRKDYAFVNYTTREAALACIDWFSHESFTDDGSKVNVKVSLAKPIPKLKQIKQTPSPTNKESSQVKLKVAPSVSRLHEARTMRISSISNHGSIGVDGRSSTTAELVGLLREQASWRQPQMASVAGSLVMDRPYSAPGTKRPFSTLRDDPLYSDPRQYSRARLESSFPVASPSGLSHAIGTTSLPYYHRQPTGYAPGSLFRVGNPPNNFQTHNRAPDHGSSGLYRRWSEMVKAGAQRS